MKIVIEMPEEVKQAFDNADDINFSYYDYNSVIGKAIRNGTPLESVLEDIKREIADIKDFEVVNGGVYVREYEVRKIIDKTSI